jgi:glycosyltransferase domain-containing protein
MTALTIVLPLKGRRLHTMRFFWHANRQHVPWRIVVADGQVEPGVAARLSPPHALFPALDIDYLPCPDDRTYQHYFNKLAAVVGRVTTPYAMLCDNDDFLVQTGVEACIAFLNDNPDYAGVSGGVAGFALHPDPLLPKVAGVIRSLGSLYHDGYLADDYDAPELSARVRRNFAGGYSLYYSVFRTEVVATVLNDIARLGLSDLKAAETFFSARVKTLGKCRLDRSIISYVRQAGTSGGGPDVWTVEDVRGTGPRAAEVQRCLTTLARPIAADVVDEQIIAGLLRELFVRKLMAEVQEKSRVAATPRQVWRDGLREAAKSMMPRGARDFRRQVLRHKAHEEISAAMLAHGASPGDVAGVRQEIRAIEATLEEPDFPAFLREHARDLLEQESGPVAPGAARAAV